MIITPPTSTRGLVVISGMKTPDEWNRMSFDEKTAWMATLTPIGLRGQASVIAVTTRRSVEAVLSTWSYSGYLSHARAVEALDAKIDAARGGEA